jgi:hypothetical protein
MIYAIHLIILALSSGLQGGAQNAGDPALAALFTPLRPQWGCYDVWTTAEPIDRSAPADLHAAEPERLEALDAFAGAGEFDRSRLAALYGGQRATVVRGWRLVADRFESLTLVSPYPDASLTRLNAGTMVIRWSLRDVKLGIISRSFQQ